MKYIALTRYRGERIVWTIGNGVGNASKLACSISTGSTRKVE
jgi:hypothetical protein